MKELKRIKERVAKQELDADEAINLIFETYLVSEDTLLKDGLEINHHGYEIYQLRQNGEYIYEGSEVECLERAKEIRYKH